MSNITPANIYEHSLAIELYFALDYYNITELPSVPSNNREVIDEWFDGDTLHSGDEYGWYDKDHLHRRLEWYGEWYCGYDIQNRRMERMYHPSHYYEKAYYPAVYYFWQSNLIDAALLGKEGIYRVMDMCSANSEIQYKQIKDTYSFVKSDLFYLPRYSKYRRAAQLHQTLKRNECLIHDPYIYPGGLPAGHLTLATANELDDIISKWRSSEEFAKVQRHYYAGKGADKSGKQHLIYDIFWEQNKLQNEDRDMVDAIKDQVHAIAVDIEYNPDLHAESMKEFYAGKYPKQPKPLTQCTKDACEGLYYSSGLCERHYNEWCDDSSTPIPPTFFQDLNS